MNVQAIGESFGLILNFCLTFYFFVVVHSYHYELCEFLERKVNQPQGVESGYPVQYQQGIPNAGIQQQPVIAAHLQPQPAWQMQPYGQQPEQMFYYPQQPPPYNPYFDQKQDI
jgi:hypothetical protein